VEVGAEEGVGVAEGAAPAAGGAGVGVAWTRENILLLLAHPDQTALLAGQLDQKNKEYWFLLSELDAVGRGHLYDDWLDRHRHLPAELARRFTFKSVITPCWPHRPGTCCQPMAMP